MSAPSERKVYFLQVENCVVHTELLILHHTEEKSHWFTDDDFTSALRQLCNFLHERIGAKMKDEKLQLYDGGHFIIACNFIKSKSKDQLLISQKQLLEDTSIPSHDVAESGMYKSFHLFSEKLKICVAKKNQANDFYNMTMNHTNMKSLPSDYFQQIKHITKSEKKKKDTLKRLFSRKTNNNFEIDFGSSNISNLDNTSNIRKISKDNFGKFKRTIPEKLHFSASKYKSHSEINNSLQSKLTRRTKRLSQNLSILELASDTAEKNEHKKLPNDMKRSTSDIETPWNMLPNQLRTVISSNASNVSIYPNYISTSEIDEDPIVPKHDELWRLRFIGHKKNEDKSNIHPKQKVVDNIEIQKRRKSISDDEDFSEQVFKPAKRSKSTRALRRPIGRSAQSNTTNRTNNLEARKINYKSSNIVNHGVDENKNNKLQKTTGFYKNSSSPNSLHISEALLKSGKENAESAVRIENLPADALEDRLLDNTTNTDNYGHVSCTAINYVRELTVVEIQDLVKSLESDLRSIFTGKLHCERHQKFKKGGRERGSLDMCVAFGIFSEEQTDKITNTLLEIFCSRHKRYFDYVMKVLLPEAMAMIYSKVAAITIEEADQIITNYGM